MLSTQNEQYQNELQYAFNQGEIQGIKNSLLIHQIPIVKKNSSTYQDPITKVEIDYNDKHFNKYFAISENKFTHVKKDIDEAKKKSYQRHIVGATRSL